jgi:hypothetical protein
MAAEYFTNDKEKELYLKSATTKKKKRLKYK